MEGGWAASDTRSRCCKRRVMMHGGIGATMAGTGLVWILVIAVVVLALVAAQIHAERLASLIHPNSKRKGGADEHFNPAA